MSVHTVNTQGTESPAILAERIRDALSSDHLVQVQGAGSVDLNWWDEVIAEIGHRIVVDEGSVDFHRTRRPWQDICFDPKMQHTFRHSKTAQPLHTDGAYESNPGQVLFFVCEHRAPRGGETLFLDGADLYDLLVKTDPELCQKLLQTPVCFSKADFQRQDPILSAANGKIELVWNQYRVAPEESKDIQELALQFTRFLHREVVVAERAHAVHLAPGDAVFFHDANLLHGRKSFEAERYADRLLWKGGLNVEKVA